MLKESIFPGRRFTLCLLIVLAGWLSVSIVLWGVRAAGPAEASNTLGTNKGTAAAPATRKAGSPSPIAYGDMVTGTIAAPGQSVSYTLNGLNGEYASVRV